MKNDLSAQFDSLNKEIVLQLIKICARNAIDQARQEILHDLASSDMRAVDADFSSVEAICA